MKIFKFLAVALLAIVGLGSCEKHECYDHSADLVGTWTCLQENYAEALVISADGSLVSTGVAFGEHWENVKGKIVVKDEKVTMTFDDNDNYQGHFDIIPGMAFSICNDEGRRFTYNYCKEDLSDEIVGMWVCNDGRVDVENDMMIQTFNADGSLTYTGYAPLAGGFSLNGEGTYKVIGDLAILKLSEGNLVEGASEYMVKKLNYSPMGTAMGDIITFKGYYNGEEMTSSWLRINQTLDLPGKKYDYIKTYVSNVKGADKDIEFMGLTFNFAKMDGSELDKLLKAILFNIEFPDANTLNYTYNYNNVKETLKASIVVEGNKMTIKMSEKVPTFKDVVLYAFQDADCSQMHFYMNRTAFVNFHANMQTMLIASQDKMFDITNADAVNTIYNNINNAVETINVSLVMSNSSKAR